MQVNINGRDWFPKQITLIYAVKTQNNSLVAKNGHWQVAIIITFIYAWFSLLTSEPSCKLRMCSISFDMLNDFEFPLIIMDKPAEPSLASNMLLSVQKSDAFVSSETVPLVHKLVL